MKVRIAFVTNADGEIDTGRVGTIEDHPDEEAQQLIRAGVAVKATAEEIADAAALASETRQPAATGPESTDRSRVKPAKAAPDAAAPAVDVT